MSVQLSWKNKSPQQNKHEFKIMFMYMCLYLFMMDTQFLWCFAHYHWHLKIYISITTCKQHNSPVGSLGFWVDQFLWDSWVPFTHEFTSSTNSSFFLFMQIHDITSPWKTMIPRFTILNDISYIKYK